MYEKEVVEIQKKITAIVDNSGNDPQSAVAKLLKIEKEARGFGGDKSPAFYSVAATVHEAAGDIWMKAKKVGEAEKEFLEMMKMSVKMYELDKVKYDFRLGFSYYKRATFYRTVIQCATMGAKPKELTELQKKMFELAEGLYKNAVACTMENAKKGAIRYVNLHALIMSELLVLYASVGDYEKAIACGKDGIKLEKAIYEKMDDKAHSFRLANRMNALAAVYTFAKNVQAAAEILEDSIYVLEEHEEEDPITFGMMLARNYLSLAGGYSQIPEEASNAEATYKKGLERMTELNKKSNNKFINDLITAYMLVGDYYKRTGNGETAKVYYRWAMKQASDLWGATKNPQYENIIKRLTPFV